LILKSRPVADKAAESLADYLFAATWIYLIFFISSTESRMIHICKKTKSTNCAWQHNMPPVHPLQIDNIFTFIHQVALLFRHNNIFVFIRQVAPVLACWVFKTSATS